jgi:hypothetical protein
MHALASPRIRARRLVAVMNVWKKPTFFTSVILE